MSTEHQFKATEQRPCYSFRFKASLYSDAGKLRPRRRTHVGEMPATEAKR